MKTSSYQGAESYAHFNIQRYHELSDSHWKPESIHLPPSRPKLPRQASNTKTPHPHTVVGVDQRCGHEPNFCGLVKPPPMNVAAKKLELVSDLSTSDPIQHLGWIKKESPAVSPNDEEFRYGINKQTNTICGSNMPTGLLPDLGPGTVEKRKSSKVPRTVLHNTVPIQAPALREGHEGSTMPVGFVYEQINPEVETNFTRIPRPLCPHRAETHPRGVLSQFLHDMGFNMADLGLSRDVIGIKTGTTQPHILSCLDRKALHAAQGESFACCGSQAG